MNTKQHAVGTLLILRKKAPMFAFRGKGELTLTGDYWTARAGEQVSLVGFPKRVRPSECDRSVWRNMLLVMSSKGLVLVYPDLVRSRARS